MSETVYGPIITGCGTLLFGWLLISGLRSGTMEWGYFGNSFSGRRSDQPIRFWIAFAVLAFLTLLTLLGTIAQIVWPNGF